jgi:DNA ligase-1
MLKEATSSGYEGIVMKNPMWEWKSTKSRTVDFCKWKRRPTADLLCISTTEGTGKYEGMIGALVLQDSKGRVVQVGSGLNDDDRLVEPDNFIGNVVEIEYEQIMETYIQPTFITIRLDKTKEDID